MHPQLRGPEAIAGPLLPLPVQVLSQASALQNGIEPDESKYPKSSSPTPKILATLNPKPKDPSN